MKVPYCIFEKMSKTFGKNNLKYILVLHMMLDISRKGLKIYTYKPTNGAVNLEIGAPILEANETLESILIKMDLDSIT